MVTNPVSFETILTNSKQELDELDNRIKACQSSANDIKPHVVTYSELKHQEKDLRNLRRVKAKEFEIKMNLFAQVTGKASDEVYAMYPLFNQDNNPTQIQEAQS